ncbi:MAG: bifunctional phosphoribosylaminoimidazolecarboxamide formyltransferase/IMP cyclohydrolase [Clostridiales bacterium]|nr:bifunctional phosphoribosylaminoimidazolecarboxamide formyltransferase/IMP cyclohydrolase [Clostridiales bacterium]
MIKRALISVSDKTGIIELSAELQNLGVEIISTGGTAKALAEAGIKVTNISDVTGFPECLDGRVKTLHPSVHGGILAMRSNKAHMDQIKELGIEPIDMVIINLYPFKQTIMKDHVELEEAIENIDIGGPTMIRAAAKNYQDVAVVVDPADYQVVLDEIKVSGDVSVKTKFRLAYKVFEHTSSYDTLISKYLRDQIKEQTGEEFFPENLSLTFEKVQDMRYGENPHQKAVFYKEAGKNTGCITNAKQLHGKELSFNNINDANGALELLKEFERPTAVIVKHANPCGVASSDSLLTAYVKAYETDTVSAFGGIVAVNRAIDATVAEEMGKIFYEVIIAPSYTPEALQILEKKKNIRIMVLDDISAKLPAGAYDVKKVSGGLLVQNINSELVNLEEIKCVTEKQLEPELMGDLLFAMKVVKHTKSNAIVMAKDSQVVGIGPGQMNRITSLNIAANYGGEKCKGAVMASDAFFPFNDCVEAAAAAGIIAIIQPGGSVRDQDSIDACNKHGIAMVFTGIRHFKH